MRSVFITAVAAIAVIVTGVFIDVAATPSQDCCGQVVPVITGQQGNGQQQSPTKYHRGRVASRDIAVKHIRDRVRHAGLSARLPKATATSYDCRTLGLVTPVEDQGPCGTCWLFSGDDIVTSALIKAGYGPNDGTFTMSKQYVLDCTRNGGCDGDDNTTVLEIAKNHGIPTTKDYGPYQPRRSQCQFKESMPVYKLADYGFCDDGEPYRVASTQDIKNFMVQFGPIGCAVAADGSWDSYRGGIYKPSGSRNIDHDVVLVGWQDDASIREGGYWFMKNSWGRGWGEDGYMKIPYGANQIGYEAVWCSAVPLPSPPPGPQPPSPTPPLPTGPYLTIPQALPPGQYQIVPWPSKT